MCSLSCAHQQHRPRRLGRRPLVGVQKEVPRRPGVQLVFSPLVCCLSHTFWPLMPQPTHFDCCLCIIPNTGPACLSCLPSSPSIFSRYPSQFLAYLVASPLVYPAPTLVHARAARTLSPPRKLANSAMCTVKGYDHRKDEQRTVKSGSDHLLPHTGVWEMRGRTPMCGRRWSKPPLTGMNHLQRGEEFEGGCRERRNETRRDKTRRDERHETGRRDSPARTLD